MATRLTKPYVSNGNYEVDAQLEDHSKPLYGNQAALPRLPLPSLDQTLER